MRDFFNPGEISASPKEAAAPVGTLLERLREIDPNEMASALCTLEFHNQLKEFQIRTPHFEMDESQLFFSRGLKDEVENIYLELASHLRAKTQGANVLLDAVFDLFTRTLASLPRVAHFVSNN